MSETQKTDASDLPGPNLRRTEGKSLSRASKALKTGFPTAFLRIFRRQPALEGAGIYPEGVWGSRTLRKDISSRARRMHCSAAFGGAPGWLTLSTAAPAAFRP